MIGWLILLVWVVGAVWSAPSLIHRSIEASRIGHELDTADVVTGLLGGVAGAALWPLTLPIAHFVRAYLAREHKDVTR